MATKEGDLQNFLVNSFAIEELRRFVYFGFNGYSLSSELPSSSLSMAHFSATVVDLLRRRGMIDTDFFERLKDARPKRAREIEHLERQWLTEPGTTAPLTHHLTGSEPTGPRETVDQEPVRIFVSYSHRDRSFVEELRSHLALLQRQGLIEVWHDGEITAGEEWSRVIDQQLDSANIILLLISASFLASDFCWNVELRKAIQRHEQGTAVVIPVILRPCLWDEAPFAKLQAVPRDGKPITRASNTDEAWVEVATEIRKAIRTMKREK